MAMTFPRISLSVLSLKKCPTNETISYFTFENFFSSFFFFSYPSPCVCVGYNVHTHIIISFDWNFEWNLILNKWIVLFYDDSCPMKILDMAERIGANELQADDDDYLVTETVNVCLINK